MGFLGQRGYPAPLSTGERAFFVVLDASDRGTGMALGNNREVSALAAFSGFLSATLAIILLGMSLLGDTAAPVFTDGEANTPFFVSVEFIVFSTALAAFLAIASGSNDLLITAHGRKTLLYSGLVIAPVGSASFLIEGAGSVFAVSAALLVCVFILLWGICLSTFNHQVLLVLLLLTSVFTGLFMLVFSSLHLVPTAALVLLLFCLSWVFLRMTVLEEANFITRALSKERHLPGKRNSFTLFLVGSMFGAIAVMLHSLRISPTEVAFVLGTCFVLAGLFMLLAYYRFQSRVGDVAKRTLSLVMMLALAPFPFLGRTGQIACVCLVCIAGTINLILIIDAISETARFNQISPIWLVGFEGMMLFMGVAFVSALALLLPLWPGRGIIAFAVILATVGCMLQININNQTYPLFSEALDANPAIAADMPSGEGDLPGTVQSSAFWRERIDAIAGQYGLSLRQKEIMELLVKGRDSKYITEHFCISRSTAKTHVYNLYRKINIHSRQELLDLIEEDGCPSGV
jgi:DNA-binding CsgD family transcriptional regulator